VVIEGPVITIIAGFLASTKFFDPVPTYLTILTGNLTGDILYYSAGRWWFTNSIRKLTDFFKVRKARITKIESQLKMHSGKVIFFGKLSHILSGVILVASGVVEIPFGKYLLFCFLSEAPKSLILFLVGYFFGSTVSNYGKYLNLTFIGLILLTLILIGTYAVVTYVSNKLITKLDS
jgi:membrane protein DedA with SNARE-associated domain